MDWSLLVSVVALCFSAFAFFRTHSLSKSIRELKDPILEFSLDIGTFKNEHLVLSITNHGTSPAEIVGWTFFLDGDALPQMINATQWHEIFDSLDLEIEDGYAYSLGAGHAMGPQRTENLYTLKLRGQPNFKDRNWKSLIEATLRRVNIKCQYSSLDGALFSETYLTDPDVYQANVKAWRNAANQNSASYART